MANFAGIIDRDPTRRSQFLARARDKVAILPGLDVQTREHGDFAVVWAAAKTAPVDIDQNENGVAVLWGRARKAGSADCISAQECRNSLAFGDASNPPLWDGYHAYVSYDAERGLCLGADLLGLFPIYYWEGGGVLLFGSSENLFPSHPSFSPKLNFAGMIGILLTMHLVGGQTLLEGVRRLGAGWVLVRTRGNPVREEKRFQFPVSDNLIDLGLDEQADLLAEVLSDAVRRHVTRGQPSLLSLSGGRDSRMVAGFMRQNGLEFSAFTMGVTSDIEYQCARSVAQHLQVEQQLIEIPFAEYRELAELAAEWEQLANGFNCIYTWGLAKVLQQEQATEIVTGYLADTIVGGTHIGWAYDPEQRALSFDKMFENINAWGVHPNILKKLLRNQAQRDLVEDVIQSLRTTYETYDGHPFQRALSFDLQHRQRFHTGGNLWPLSFSGWPVLPTVDYEVLKIAFGLPAASLMGRRIQDHVLIRRFIGLARLPLDRNCEDIRPLAPRPGWLVLDRLKREVRRMLPTPAKSHAFDNLFYYRIFDFNNSGWRAVRGAADECRDGLAGLFDERALNDLLPPASKDVCLDIPIAGAASLKTLLGFAIWWRSFSPSAGLGVPPSTARCPEEASFP
jgi:asparagine synthase (glutamine-hydrolysing)